MSAINRMAVLDAAWQIVPEELQNARFGEPAAGDLIATMDGRMGIVITLGALQRGLPLARTRDD